MTLRHMKIYVAVFQHSNITRAAEELHLGPAVGESGGEGAGGILRCAALRAAGTADSAHRSRAGILRLRPAHCVAL